MCPNNNAVFGAACVTQCKDGFKLTGSYFASCDENGDWRSVAVCKGNSLFDAFSHSKIYFIDMLVHKII